MSLYTAFFVRFLHGVVDAFREAEAFVFHTRLAHVSPSLRDRNVTRAVDKLALMAQGIGGGTRIGESLATFNRWHARRVINSRTAVMIVSDGYDTGEPEELGAEMRRLAPALPKDRLAQSADRLARLRAGRRAACRRRCPRSISSRRRTISKASPRSSLISRGSELMDRADRHPRHCISAQKAKGEPFALATVVRTVAATAAKAGAKAVILPDGTISEGWIGGGCARAAVLKAAQEALADGQSRLVSVQPPDVLQEKGVAAGEEREGVRFVKNMCPSQGTMDIFVEPVLPRPEIVVCGSSPVAVALADLGRRLGFAITACAPAAEQAAFAEADRRIEGYALPVTTRARAIVVVSTQGRGDEAALQAALAVDADYVAFVGSRRKAEALKASSGTRGVAPSGWRSSRRPPASTSARSRRRRSRSRFSRRSSRCGACSGQARGAARAAQSWRRQERPFLSRSKYARRKIQPLRDVVVLLGDRIGVVDRGAPRTANPRSGRRHRRAHCARIGDLL